ncbi:MAG TPA: hypothetical protein DCL98_01965 [Flavobacteriales bacterium]|nr:hypothetical protein [Flavobacteriales bacterium]
MGKLALLWDGAWLRWAMPHESQARQREISRADMVPEVLTAIRNQVGAGSDVVCAEWGAPTTMVPSELSEGQGRDVLVGAHAKQHGATTHDGVLVEAFNRGGTRCHMVTGGENAWSDHVLSMFPQAHMTSMASVMAHEAIRLSQAQPKEAWVFRVHMCDQGMHGAAAAGQVLQWEQFVQAGCTSEDALYAMVNACHRSGADVKDALVVWSGDAHQTEGWRRFLTLREAQPQAADGGWEVVLNLMRG